MLEEYKKKIGTDLTKNVTCMTGENWANFNKEQEVY